jgi:hypothetical protein
VVWGDVDWIGLAQDRNRWRALVISVLNLWVPQNVGKLSSNLNNRVFQLQPLHTTVDPETASTHVISSITVVQQD